MADYSFSSSAMRKRKSNLKTKSVLGESSGTPPPSLSAQTPSPATSSTPTSRTTSPRSKTGSKVDTKESISPVPQSNTPNDNNNNNSTKVQQYIQNINNSKWPPPMVSDDSDHEILPDPKGKGRPRNVWQPPRTKVGKTFKREPSLEDSSVDSSDDASDGSSPSGDEESASSSDDSEQETTKKIDKYRLKYLNGDVDGKNYGKATRDTRSPPRDTQSEEGTTTYDKYKKQFNESKRSDEKWLSPKKKLGAAPDVDYNYRYLNAPKLPLEDSSQSELLSIPDPNRKPKLGKVDLKSQKIDKDDLGILASMLGDDSSMGEVSSQGIFSAASEDDSGIMGTPQRSESIKKLSVSSRGLSNNSAKSNKSYNILQGDTEALEAQSLEGIHSSEGGIKKKPESPKEPVSIRMAKLQHQRREKETNSTSSHSARSMTSDLDESMSSPAPEIKKRISSVGVPPVIREDEVEENLGHFLEKEHKTRVKEENKAETSERSEDDFSAIWAQSVAASRTNSKVRPQVDDESSTEGSIDIQGQQQSLQSAPRAKAEPTLNSVKEKKTERPSMSRQGATGPPSSSTATLEASNSTSHYEASGRSSVSYASSSAIETSARWGASDELQVEQNTQTSYATHPQKSPPPTTLPSTRDAVMRDNLDSESDESVDFEKLTGMEQYTMGDSKGSSLELETPVVSNKKETKPDVPNKNERKPDVSNKKEVKPDVSSKKETKPEASNKKEAKPDVSTKKDTKPDGSNKKETKPKRDEKDPNRKNEQKGQLMAISNVQVEEIERGGEDSDASLDMLNAANTRQHQQTKEAPEKMKSTPRDDDDDSSMSGFSLYPSKDLIDEKSSTEFNKPEYQPQRNNMSAGLDFNEGFQNLDSSELVDLEDPQIDPPVDPPLDEPEIKTETKVPSTEKPDNDVTKNEETKPKIPARPSLFSTGLLRHVTRTWALLFASAAIGLPIYFLLFFGDEDATLPAPLDLFPLPPTLAPSVAPVAPPTFPPVATTMPVTQLPTQMPSIPSVPEIPTNSPTRSRISLLREFLISVWPSLEDDLIGVTSPQFAALNWLANNANYDEYSDERLIQRFALATLFYSTRGIGWRNSDLWLSDADECTWYSRSSQPQCDGNGNYIRLSLGLNNLWGTIPPEVALLENLLEIDFSTSSSVTSLSSTIPSEIGLLEDLEALILRGNDLSGTLASEIGNLANLDNLDLSSNRLSGALPSEVGGLTRLRFWNLSQNDFNGSIPTTLGLMTTLEKVQLNNNEFTGPIPAELGQLSLLNSVDLTNNRLSRLPTELDTLVLLQKFSAANNQLEGSIPTGIGNSIELLSLELQNNKLTGTIPTEIGNLVELRDVLDLSSNEFSGPIPTEIGRLIFLRNILFQNNRLTGNVPSSFAALRRVSVLRLESNDLTGVVPNATCAVFNQTYPVFATDCTPPEIECPCCMFCCEDNGDCTCQFADTDLSFLCSEFTRAPGLEDRIVT